MRTKTQKWGNSLALRIPRAFAREARLAEDAPVEMTLEAGRIIIVPVAAEEINLEKLLAGVSERNIHREADFGPVAGDEAW